MWIPKTISESGEKLTGAVTSADTVSGETVAPFGIAYAPLHGEKALSVQIGNTNYILGVCRTPPTELSPGEIGLYSSGGASIVLKNDGRVLINGREFESGGDEV